MRHRAWALLLVIPAALLALDVWGSPFLGFHAHLVADGTPKRFVATIVRAGRADARGAIWLDNVYLVAWLLVVPRILRMGLERWCPDRRRRFGWWSTTPRLAVLGGVLGLATNTVALSLVGREAPPTIAVLAVSVLGWSRWVCVVPAVIGVFGLVIGPLAASVVRPALRRAFGLLDRATGSHPPLAATSMAEREARSDEPVDGERIGICVSGGGIRAASVALGALRSLDRDIDGAPSIFRRARWLSGVSGGAYVAGGWRISRRPGGHLPPMPTDRSDGLFAADHPWALSVRHRLRFLENGVGSIAGGVANLLLRTVLVLGGLLSATYVLGWLAGHAIRTRALHASFPFTSPARTARLTLADLLPLRISVPGGLWLAIALVVLAGSVTRADPDRRAAARRAGVPFLALAAAFFVVTVAVPAAVIEVPRLFRRLPVATTADEGAGALGVLSSLGIVGALGGVVVSELKRRWLRLGGVLLATVLVLFGGKVATVAAEGGGGAWASWPIWGRSRVPVLVAAVLWLVLLDCIASHRLTLGGLYRKRLAETFALGDGERAPLRPLEYSSEPLWPAYVGASGPELITVATAHSSTLTASGVKGLAYTFRPDRVTLHDRTDGTSASVPSTAYPVGSWWDGFPRGWIVSRSMALTGGAFASAMGRQALGTTQALLVAFNLRLGAWVPNPRFVEWFADPVTSPRVHLGYLLKELLGRYDTARDAFVYVADGGHRENLGLVELLRERPDVVCCVDSSGDQLGSFETLRQAVRLAATELGVDVDVPLERLRGDAGVLPLDCAVEGTIEYPEAFGGGTGRLLYGRYQLSEEAPPALLQFGAAHPPFPSYSTADQYLTEKEHLQLVALGEHVGQRIVGLFAGVSA